VETNGSIPPSDRSLPFGVSVDRVIEEAEARLIDLPPYEPDVNPIEQVIAKPKTLDTVAQGRRSPDPEGGVTALTVGEGSPLRLPKVQEGGNRRWTL
jgi:hypothetical protein